MCNFNLRRPTLRYPRTTGPNLGVGRLQLDPEIRALLSAPPSPRLRDLMLRPNWAAMDRAWLNERLAAPPTTPPTAPPVTQGRGPAVPRPGEVSDFLRAVWGIPSIQQAANRVLQEAGRRFQRDWNRLGTGGQIAIVTQSAVITGGAIAGAMTQSESRQFVFRLVIGRDIPIPGVDGLQFRILERGGQASWNNIGGSGISARAGGSVGDTGRFQGEARIMLDLTRWVPALR